MLGYDNELGFICDDCGESIGGPPLSYMESKILMEDSEWVATYENGETIYRCKKCAEKIKETT